MTPLWMTLLLALLPVAGVILSQWLGNKYGLKRYEIERRDNGQSERERRSFEASADREQRRAEAYAALLSELRRTPHRIYEQSQQQDAGHREMHQPELWAASSLAQLYSTPEQRHALGEAMNTFFKGHYKDTNTAEKLILDAFDLQNGSGGCRPSPSDGDNILATSDRN